MICQRIFLKKYNWKLVVLYNAKETDSDNIKNILSEICNDEYTINKSVRYIAKGEYNTGFIYSNYISKASLIVIGKATSKQQFINTIAHEANHLQSHIATVYNLDEKGEEVCYLIGNIIEKMFKAFNKIIC